jgi:hypothetical protein
MNTRYKIMGLAALPLAGLLATGGVAMAHTAGAPAGTQVVQQAAVHRAGDPCPDHPVTGAAQQDRLPLRDRDGSCDRQQTQTATRTMDQLRVHDGSCDHADR